MKFWQKAFEGLILAIALAIAFDHKYDKPLRYLSLKLAPLGLEIPLWFEKRISYYTTDFLLLGALLIALFALRVPLRKFLFERGTWLLCLVGSFAFSSILFSPFASYPVPYFRAGQLLLTFLLYPLILSISRERIEKIVPLSILGIAGVGFIQSVIAIAQYFIQGSLGLRFLGEPKIYPLPNFSTIWSPHSARWIFDLHPNPPEKFGLIIRSLGTFSSPNILGGFLAMTALMTLFLFSKYNGWKKWLFAGAFSVQILALFTTYSRSALFGFLIAFSIWGAYRFWMYKWRNEFVSLLLVSFSFAFAGILLHEQILYRGGIVNYNAVSRGADSERIKYQEIAKEMIWAHPLTGVGFTQFNTQIVSFLKPNQDPTKYRSAAHNIFLLLASETGLPSVICYFSFMALLLWKSLCSKKTELIALTTAIFVAFLFIGMCDYYLLLFQQGRLMFILIAAFLSTQLRAQTDPQV